MLPVQLCSGTHAPLPEGRAARDLLRLPAKLRFQHVLVEGVIKRVGGDRPGTIKARSCGPAQCVVRHNRRLQWTLSPVLQSLVHVTTARKAADAHSALPRLWAPMIQMVSRSVMLKTCLKYANVGPEPADCACCDMPAPHTIGPFGGRLLRGGNGCLSLCSGREMCCIDSIGAGIA